MSDPTHILFYDLETTGTDETRDGILEVGCLLHSIAFGTVRERSWIVTPTNGEQDRLIRNDFVYRMHVESGLNNAIRAGHGNRIARVDESVAAWIVASTGSEKHVISAGSGVAHFDRRFVKRHMPLFDARMTYYSMDVGVMRRICDHVGRGDLNLDQKTKTHRALDDARFHYQEWRHYCQVLAGAMAPVPEDALQ